MEGLIKQGASEAFQPGGELSEIQKTAVVEWTRKWLKIVASRADEDENKPELPVRDADHPPIPSLNDLPIDDPSCAIQAHMLFFDTLIQEFQSVKWRINDRSAIGTFLLSEKYSPLSQAKIMRSLPIGYHVHLVTRINRMPEFQRTIGMEIARGLLYAIDEIGSDAGKRIASEIKYFSLAESMDVIHQLRSLALSAAEMHWIEPIGPIYNAIDKIARNNPYPFMKLMSLQSIAEIRIAVKKQKDKTSNSLRSPENFSHEGNLLARTDEYADYEWYSEDLKLQESIELPVHQLFSRHSSLESPTLQRIANNAIGIFDHSMMLQMFMYDEVIPEVHPGGPSLAFASKLISEIDRGTSAWPDLFFRDRLFSCVMLKSPAELADVCSRVSTVLTKNEWLLYFNEAKELLKNKEKIAEEPHRVLCEKMADHADILYKDLRMAAKEVIKKAPYQLARPTTYFLEALHYFAETNPFSQDTQEDFTLLMKHFHRPALRRHIERVFKISYEDIPLQSQVHFLRFLATADSATFKRFVTICTQAPDWRFEFFDAFACASHDITFGHIILDIAERLSATPAYAKKVFQNISTITSAIDDVKSYLHEQFQSYADREKIRPVVQNLVRRAQHFIMLIALSQEGSAIKVPEKLSSEIALFAATLKSMREKSQKVSLSEFVSVDFTILQGDELRVFALNEENRQKMESIYRSRYSDPKYPESFKQKLVDSLHSAIEKGNTTLYVVKHKGEIVAFCRFEEQENGNLYFGSFVVDERYDNHRLGMALLEESLLKLGETRRIEADCDPDTPAAKLYAKLGFHVTRKYTFEGVLSTHIVREPDTIRLQEQVPA